MPQRLPLLTRPRTKMRRMLRQLLRAASAVMVWRGSNEKMARHQQVRGSKQASRDGVGCVEEEEPWVLFALLAVFALTARVGLLLAR